MGPHMIEGKAGSACIVQKNELRAYLSITYGSYLQGNGRGVREWLSQVELTSKIGVRQVLGE